MNLLDILYIPNIESSENNEIYNGGDFNIEEFHHILVNSDISKGGNVDYNALLAWTAPNLVSKLVSNNTDVEFTDDDYNMIISALTSEGYLLNAENNEITFNYRDNTYAVKSLKLGYSNNQSAIINTALNCYEKMMACTNVNIIDENNWYTLNTAINSFDQVKSLITFDKDKFVIEDKYLRDHIQNIAQLESINNLVHINYENIFFSSYNVLKYHDLHEFTLVNKISNLEFIPLNTNNILNNQNNYLVTNLNTLCNETFTVDYELTTFTCVNVLNDYACEDDKAVYESSISMGQIKGNWGETTFETGELPIISPIDNRYLGNYKTPLYNNTLYIPIFLNKNYEIDLNSIASYLSSNSYNYRSPSVTPHVSSYHDNTLMLRFIIYPFIIDNSSSYNIELTNDYILSGESNNLNICKYKYNDVNLINVLDNGNDKLLSFTQTNAIYSDTTNLRNMQLDANTATNVLFNNNIRSVPFDSGIIGNGISYNCQSKISFDIDTNGILNAFNTYMYDVYNEPDYLDYFNGFDVQFIPSFAWTYEKYAISSRVSNNDITSNNFLDKVTNTTKLYFNRNTFDNALDSHHIFILSYENNNIYVDHKSYVL